MTRAKNEHLSGEFWCRGRDRMWLPTVDFKSSQEDQSRDDAGDPDKMRAYHKGGSHRRRNRDSFSSFCVGSCG